MPRGSTTLTEDNREQTPFGAPPPDPELKRLEPLVGKWRSGEHTLEGVLGPGVPVTSIEEFSWLDGGYFLVYELDDEGRVELNPDGTLSVAWWRRGEDGEWPPWMTNTFSRTDR